MIKSIKKEYDALKKELDDVEERGKSLVERSQKNEPEILALYPNLARNAVLKAKAKIIWSYVWSLFLIVVMSPVWITAFILISIWMEIRKSLTVGYLGECFPFSRTSEVEHRLYFDDSKGLGIVSASGWDYKIKGYDGKSFRSISESYLKKLDKVKESAPGAIILAEDRFTHKICVLGLHMLTLKSNHMYEV